MVEIIWRSLAGRPLLIRTHHCKPPVVSCGAHRCCAGVRRASRLVVRAQDEVAEEDEAESRLEALENQTARRKAKPKLERPRGAPESAWSEWREGELLPEAWDDLNVFQKAAELYTGKRGLLFWLNKFAFGAVIGIAVLWIVFRFVGPQLGLYELRATLTDASL